MTKEQLELKEKVEISLEQAFYDSANVDFSYENFVDCATKQFNKDFPKLEWKLVLIRSGSDFIEFKIYYKCGFDWVVQDAYLERETFASLDEN